MEKLFFEKLVPDTSVIIEGLLSKKIKCSELKADSVIIHEAVISELEYQADSGKAIGFLGLDEIKRLRELSNESNEGKKAEKEGKNEEGRKEEDGGTEGTCFELRVEGQRLNPAGIRYASLGEIDSLVRQLAFDEDGTLITSNKVQNEAALARGIRVVYFRPETAAGKLKLGRFFDENTMSVHLRENVVPYAKKGFPGSWSFVALRKKELSQEEIQDISREIIENTKLMKDGFVEIEREGSTIVQLGNYRIVITKPPFSDGWEITAVRPVKRMSIEEYRLSEKLGSRIREQAEGILVAGSPGMGKSTFAQALAEFYASKEKIVKTVEAPRDLILSERITQYAISHGDAQEIHDILLLSRPDYTIFDEMRNTDDFRLFADLRLAGVGMVGVVHATNPIDAIQRFIGRVEMGVIPQIIDTVVFIRDGAIRKVLSLKMVVKVPSGMTEADLARPVVIVNDFESEKLIYEIYSYGEQTVVVPVQEELSKAGVHRLAEENIAREISAYADDVEVNCVSDNKCIIRVPEKNIARLIGKEGRNVIQLEKKLGMSIDIQPLDINKGDINKGAGRREQEVPFDAAIKKNSILFQLGIKMQDKDIDIYVNNEFVLTAKAGKTGLIKIKKNNPMGRMLIRAYHNGAGIRMMG